MNIPEYLTKIQKIQNELLKFLENESNTEENYQNFINIIDEYKLCNTKHDIILFLHLISQISTNHHRMPNFIIKIERILQRFQNDIQNNLTNSEIYNLFKNNKRILLFLIESSILILNENIIKDFFTPKNKRAAYPQYFQPEIKPFLANIKVAKKECSTIESDELPDNFYEKRKVGENHNTICELIRNDSIKDFIAYVNKNNCQLQSIIEPSIYETNPPLINNQLELIEYAAFFGSIQIFNYLKLNGIELNKEILIFAIHGENAEIIHSLEENIDKNQYIDYLIVSIICHHNDIAKYFIDNYIQNSEIYSEILNNVLKYYNFSFIHEELINENALGCLCQYDYYFLTSVLLNEKNIDVNKIHLK